MFCAYSNVLDNDNKIYNHAQKGTNIFTLWSGRLVSSANNACAYCSGLNDRAENLLQQISRTCLAQTATDCACNNVDDMIENFFPFGASENSICC